MITTQKSLRAAFWEAHPYFKRGVKRVGTMCRNGEISDALAERATL